MYTSGNWQIRRSDSDSENQAEEKIRKSGERRDRRAEGFCGHILDKNIRFTNLQIRRSGNQAEEKIRKSGERDVKG